jgi:hypothetical protein
MKKHTDIEKLETDVRQFIKSFPDWWATRGCFLSMDTMNTSPEHVVISPLPKRVEGKTKEERDASRKASRDYYLEKLRYAPDIHEQIKRVFRGRARKMVRDGTSIYLVP